MTKTKFQHGDEVVLKGHTYGKVYFDRHLPKGAHGRSCALVELILTSHHKANQTFEDCKMGLVKTFRLVDIKPKKKEVR